MLKSPEFLRQYVRVLNEVVSYVSTARRLGMDESTVFVWLRQSKAAAERGDDPSEWLVEIDGETRYFHQHCKRADDNCTEHIQANAKQRARDGVWVPSMFKGETVYKRDPRLIGKPWLIDMLGLDDDLQRDPKTGLPVPEMQYIPPSTDLTMGILAANSKKYARKSSLDVTMSARISGGVIFGGGPRAPSIAAPLPVLEIVQDAIEPERVAVDEPQPVDDADEPEASGLEDDDMTVTATPPPADEIAEPLPATPAPEPMIRAETPKEYVSGPNPLIAPRNGRPLSNLERDLLSKLPSNLARAPK